MKIKKKMKKKMKKDHGGGDCYEANGRWYLQNGGKSSGLILCHGEVTGQGPLQGVKFGHCWIEEHNEANGMVTVHDYSATHGKEGLHVPAYKYYAVGQIGSNVVRYTHESFVNRLNAHSTWGPWDFKSSTGL